MTAREETRTEFLRRVGAAGGRASRGTDAAKIRGRLAALARWGRGDSREALSLRARLRRAKDA